ncbi:MAG: DUF1565 domain-containing protein [Bacteroidales bacterium]|nr:DUF1565 domain-containing protein [Bacteroidales bacterium]
MNRKSIFRALAVVSVMLAASLSAQAQLYVSSQTGNNSNDGSKGAPLKNIQKAIDVASDNATIYVAEGNYYGTLNKGNINVTKPVKIMGGYKTDFSERDVLKYLTMVQPTPEANGTTEATGGTMTLKINTPNTEVVIDGLIFDRGNSISYNAKGDGKPAGVASPMMNPIGAAGIGGPELTTTNVLTKQTSMIYLNNSRCDITIRNCAFINGPNYAINGMFGGKKATITNNIFINIVMAACEISGGGMANETKEVHFTYNTVLFSWARTRDLGDMGYGYRYMTGNINHYVSNNIIGLSTFAGIDRTRSESDKTKDAARITTAENNIFFLNKQGDLTLPGGGMFMRVNVEDFADVDQLAKSGGNKSMADPKVFKGIINEPYLNGFLSASYKETATSDPNAPENKFRQAMGMNQTGTIQSSVSMYANRYPWKEALKFFGAMNGYGAQKIKN